MLFAKKSIQAVLIASEANPLHRKRCYVPKRALSPQKLPALPFATIRSNGFRLALFFRISVS